MKIYFKNKNLDTLKYTKNTIKLTNILTIPGGDKYIIPPKVKKLTKLNKNGFILDLFKFW